MYMQTYLGKIDLPIHFLSSISTNKVALKSQNSLIAPSKLNIDEGSINNPEILEKSRNPRKNPEILGLTFSFARFFAVRH